MALRCVSQNKPNTLVCFLLYVTMEIYLMSEGAVQGVMDDPLI